MGESLPAGAGALLLAFRIGPWFLLALWIGIGLFALARGWRLAGAAIMLVGIGYATIPWVLEYRAQAAEAQAIAALDSATPLPVVEQRRVMLVIDNGYSALELTRRLLASGAVSEVVQANHYLRVNAQGVPEGMFWAPGEEIVPVVTEGEFSYPDYDNIRLTDPPDLLIVEMWPYVDAVDPLPGQGSSVQVWRFVVVTPDADGAFPVDATRSLSAHVITNDMPGFPYNPGAHQYTEWVGFPEVWDRVVAHICAGSTACTLADGDTGG
jgi:hypothetical protein